MGKIQNKNTDKKAIIKEKLRQKKKKAKKNNKRARIVVKNLPFTTTEESLKQHFGQYGSIKEIVLLRKPDGSPVGCAFIQFELVQKAAKAIHYTNEKPFLEREITVEWAKPKDKYEKSKQKIEVKIKEELPDDFDPNIQIKTEKEELLEIKKEETDENLTFEIVKNTNTSFDYNPVNSTINEEEYNNDDDDDDEMNSENQISSNANEEEKKEEESSHASSDSSEQYEDSDEENDTLVQENVKQEQKAKFMSNDASEGKTVFIKNVPFHATNDDLARCMSQFGPFFYALICIDRLTEHSKGTAFVKFKNKEDAEKCLDAKDLILLGNILDCQPALTRNALEEKVKDKSEKKAKQKDSRNLYLIKEGVVLAGSKAAEGVSESDMAKRLQLEQYKTQMLRNLNMFIAKTRIVVHNLPLNWDDQKLRALCALHADPKAVIREARIMRDMRSVDANGFGKSKGFGFVSFTTHEDALKVLRSLNNNPNIFSPKSRPIVSFSIENRSKLLVKEKRQLNSRIKNPNSTDYNQFPRRKLANDKKNKFNNNKRKSNPENEEIEGFTGITSKPGDLGFKKMRSTFHLKKQAKLHHERVKQQKKLKKNAKKPLSEKATEFTKQPKQKINKKKLKTNDNFSKLVSDYKKKILSSSSSVGGNIIKKTKWFNSSN
ncbi:RNA-binding protein 28-like [Agrilus planipennis]|uniref:RNA-binding protein 28-like n=1 Tax=Agrilus planipennis TaxID=224129 RepID=A0A1W4WW32_AGRPL|nr:RNA-binding protein 28-like [Agrilus planipennis]